MRVLFACRAEGGLCCSFEVESLVAVKQECVLADTFGAWGRQAHLLQKYNYLSHFALSRTTCLPQTLGRGRSVRECL